MCGILLFRDSAVQRDDLRVLAAMDAMRRRGPDNSEVYWNDGLALGHVRLSIIDCTPEANQPFWDATGRYVISYNGEIYNYRELREELVRGGVRLRTSGDTEVLLEWLVRHGWKTTLDRVRGMFAFILLDTLTGRILIGRDHFGQKPVYYSMGGGSLAVASSVVSVLALVGRKSPSVAAYWSYMCVPGDRGTRGLILPENTFFDDIQVLPAGHVLEVVGDDTRLHRYFRPVDLVDPVLGAELSAAPHDQLVDELGERLKIAADRHLVSDVPVGVLLSGGIDSSLVYWYAAATSEVTCFTKISPGIETIPLDVVPELLKKRPNSCFLHVQRPDDYLGATCGFVTDSGFPPRWGTAPAMNTLCRDARRNDIPVLLGGDCADEYFGGYDHYEQLFERGQLDDLGPLVSVDTGTPFYRPEVMQSYEALQRDIRGEIWDRLDFMTDRSERYAQATLLHDTTTFLQVCNLPHSDAYSMMASVELRNPMLDMDLVRFAVNLPMAVKAGRHRSGHYGKILMRDLAEREMGAVVQCQKEGTRNYAMQAARQDYWDFSRFAIREILPIPATISTRQALRLVHLEMFHRLFVCGETEFLPSILTAEGQIFWCKTHGGPAPFSPR